MNFGLFEKRIDGDDCLLELARLRFQQAGLGAEIHGGTREQLEWLLGFCPQPESPVVVHLPRDFSLTDDTCRRRIVELASWFKERALGFVLHDHPDMVARREDYLCAARDMDGRLARSGSTSVLFIEYAVGLEPNQFADFFRQIRELPQVTACIDTGHVGIWQARQSYGALHPGEDICALKSRPSWLPSVMPDVDSAVASALPVLLALIGAVGGLGKPVHFHLHDGHPLSTFSPYGVSDHLSFQTDIPLGFEFRNEHSARLLYGPEGLARMVHHAVEVLGRRRASFTLEIHPTSARLPLGDASGLFGHWVDKTHAEKMNHWLAVLAENHVLLRAALETTAGMERQRDEEAK